MIVSKVLPTDIKNNVECNNNMNKKYYTDLQTDTSTIISITFAKIIRV